MKKKDELKEFIKQLEEAIDRMLDELEAEHSRINVNLSVNLCPTPFMYSAAVSVGEAPIDVFETEKTIHAVIGLPGVEPENITLNCDGKSLEISAINAEKTYNESIELPARVKKSGMKTTYKNGILEVIFNKWKKRSTKDKA